MLEETRREAPDPVPGPGEVVCRVLACATCGSDVQDWYVARKLPAVLGHEPVGEVTAVGAGVTARGGRRPRRDPPPRAVRRLPRAAAPGTRRCASSFRATQHRPGRVRGVRAGGGGAGRRAAAARRARPGDGDVHRAARPARCAARRARGLAPEDRLLVVGAGCSGLLHIAAARARRRRRRLAWPSRDPERRERARCVGRDRHGEDELVDVADRLHARGRTRSAPPARRSTPAAACSSTRRRRRARRSTSTAGSCSCAS